MRYDWENDAPPRTPFARSVIYELHVGGFTRDPSSGVAAARRGTFAGVVDKIPYLKALGVTAVELLPVFAFDEQAAPPGLVNFWGYQPLVFFAPHPAYSISRDAVGALDEFRDMVKALHRAGIEVILDVVYNHTAEGDADGPTLSLRGLANDTYYLLEPDGDYADYTGCGNTLNANESVVRRLILDSLRYWASEMHVDGFRFDLAAVLSRDADGQPMVSPPIVRDIESDPALVARQTDRRGVGRRRPVPGRRFCRRNMEGMERPIPRRRSCVRQRRSRHGAIARVPSHRQPRRVWPPGPRAGAEHQLRCLPRRLHAERPGVVRREAQRGKRRGQSRRHRRQPQLELRRGRSHRRSGDRGIAQPSGEEFPRPDSACGRHADAARRRRGASHPARQQQRVLS